VLMEPHELAEGVPVTVTSTVDEIMWFEGFD
jgi:hypothetical protein